MQAYEKNIRLQSEAIKEKENFSFDYFFNQTKQLQDPEDTSSDDDDEDYTDLTSGDENNTKSSTVKPSKSPVRKTRISKNST